MKRQKTRFFLIKLAYWLGIVADAFWAIGMFFPQVFSILTGRADFEIDFQTRIIMGLAGSLLTGWTFLLLWAVQKPIERRVVILFTAFPVVFGITIVTLIGVLEGNTSTIWILVKNIILIISMVTSYILAEKMAREKRP